MKNRSAFLIIAILISLVCLGVRHNRRHGYVQYYRDHIIPNEHGLTAYYYDNTEWKGAPVLMRVEKKVSLGTKDGGLKGDNFSISWRGLITIPYSGTYKFKLYSDDGSWLYLNGIPIVKNDGVRPALKASIRRYIRKGVYPIEIRYFQAWGETVMDLFWRPPHPFRHLSGGISPVFLRPVDAAFDRSVEFRLKMDVRRWDLLLRISIFILLLSIVNIRTGFLERFYSWVKENPTAVIIFLLIIIFRCLFFGSVPGVQGDETWHALTASAFLEGRDISLLRGMTSYTGPYYLIQVPLYILFGFNPISLRLVPVFFNSMALLLCYLLIKRLYDTRTGLFSLLILGVWPVSYMYSRINFDITAFSPFFLFLSLYLIYRRTAGSLILAGLVLGAGIYNHLLFICVPASIFLLLFLETKGRLIFNRRFYLVLIPLLFVWGIKVMDIRYSGSGAIHSKLRIDEILYILKYSTTVILPAVLNGTVMYKLFTGKVLIKVLPVNIIILSLCIILLFIRKGLIDRNLVRLIFIIIATHVMISCIIPTTRPRYFIIPAVLMGLIPAICLSKISRFRYFSACLLTILLVTNIFYISTNYLYSYMKTRGEGIYIYDERLPFPVYARSHKYICTKELYKFIVSKGYSKVFTNYWISNNLVFWDLGKDLLICDRAEDFNGGPKECLVLYESKMDKEPGWHHEWQQSIEETGLTEIPGVKNFRVFVK